MSNGAVVNLQPEAAKQLSQAIGNTVFVREQVQAGLGSAEKELEAAKQDVRTKLAGFAADKKPLNDVIQFYTQWKGTTLLPLLNKREALEAYQDGITIKIDEYKDKHPQELAQVLMGILHELQEKYDKESKEADHIQQQIEAIEDELECLPGPAQAGSQAQTDARPARRIKGARSRRS
ncbi:MAG TPA: hypothetical protein VJ692_07205 [Nitrospiraceae bacterium]|nr:hypothetical protein [Nitrospiraceae bacterium]